MTLRIKDLHQTSRPQEKLELNGAESLSEAELLAMILRSGTQKRNVLELANELLSSAGSLKQLTAWDHRDFLKIHGIGKVKALQLATVVEIARRTMNSASIKMPILDSSDLVYEYISPFASGLHVEKFWVLSLNRKNRLIHCKELTSGTATSSLVHPREVLKEAILNNAIAIIVCHNHPSGDPTPSAADLKVTKNLNEACKTMGIDMLDHVIAGLPNHSKQYSDGYYSFADSGIL